MSSVVVTRDAGGINQVASQSPPEKVSDLHSGRLNESTESLPLLKHVCLLANSSEIIYYGCYSALSCVLLVFMPSWY